VTIDCLPEKRVLLSEYAGYNAAPPCFQMGRAGIVAGL